MSCFRYYLEWMLAQLKTWCNWDQNYSIKSYFEKSVIILKLIFRTIYFQWRSTLVKTSLQNINRNIRKYFSNCCSPFILVWPFWRIVKQGKESQSIRYQILLKPTWTFILTLPRMLWLKTSSEMHCNLNKDF